MLGPRQVGKSSLLGDLLANRPAWTILLQDYEVFQDHLRDPGLFKRQALARLEHATSRRPLVLLLDEVQKLPQLLDDCQWLLDQHRDRVRLFATGSSARKLRRANVNLLPGRIRTRFLHPLIWQEIAGIKRTRAAFHFSTKPAPWTDAGKGGEWKGALPWLDCLVWGTLPGILSAADKDRSDLLRAYALTYLREEIQAEALVRSLQGFSRFLELAAIESGNITNYQKLASDVGLSLNTVKNYYGVLFDTLVALPLEPYVRNARKRLVTSSKLYFFDIGVRNATAGLPLSRQLCTLDPGRLFEHWVVLECMRRIDYFAPHYRCYFWRTAAGAEVDLVIDTKRRLIPIEIKWTNRTGAVRLKGLRNFMADYGCKQGYVIGNFAAPEVLERGITALPWWWI